MAQGLVGNFEIQTVTIDISEDDDASTPFNTLGKIVIGIIMPSAWTAGNVLFSGALEEDGTYLPLKDEDNTEITFTGTTVDGIYLTAAASPMIGGVPWMKLRSSVAQLADRTIQVILGIVNP